MSQGSRPGGSAAPSTSQARTEVIGKVVAAARRLFAERGPAAVPLREIAREAGVNYGLIHQYIGSKDDLLRLVFQSASLDSAEEFGRADNAREAIDFLMRQRSPEFGRMLARSLLEGRDPAALLDRSPAIAELSRRIGEEAAVQGELGPQDPRVIAAMLITLSLGWGLYGDFVRTVAGLSDFTAQEVKDRMYAEALASVDLA
jgi:AcrR family transcriptional regulator